MTTWYSHGLEPDRTHPEYLINSVPLVEILGAPPRDPSGVGTKLDMLPTTAWANSEEATDRLLLKAPPDLLTGRWSILVCPVCGDPGGGVVSAVIERADDIVVWRDFGEETDLNPVPDPASVNTKIFARVGPFRFAFSQYERVVREMQQVGYETFLKWT